MEPKKKIANNTIKKIRQDLELSQGRMGKLMGITQSRCSQIEGTTNERTETKQMKCHLAAVRLLGTHGLIDELFSILETTE